MPLKNFYLQIVLRVLLIVVSAAAIAFFVALYFNWAYLSFFIALVFYQTFALINYVNKTNTKLANFIEHIRLGDTSVTFSEKSTSSSFSVLNQSFNSIIDQVKTIKIEKATQAQFLKTIVEQVDVGLISNNDEGQIRFMNRTAREILNLPDNLKNIITIDAYFPGMSTFLQSIKPKEQRLKTLNVGGELLPISFKVSIIKLPEEEVRFYIFQNIKTELDEQELESWQKLIGVLSHEIMNSITPITTLSHTINRILRSGKEDGIDSEMMEDAISCSELIEDRSKGLMDFVKKYRQLSQKIELKLGTFFLKPFFEKNIEFIQAGLKKLPNFVVTVHPESLSLTADEKLLEQVVLNLLKNAAEATEETENPTIKIHAQQKSNGRIELCISDNGKGIDETELEKIFVPFYTTKEDGSGIGLSLCKQIVQQHGGTISVKSTSGQHTAFKLIF